MKVLKIENFSSSEIIAPSFIRGGITVACKDDNGNVLGTYQTDCLDSSYWISDCKLTWAATTQAVGVPHP